jgi:cellobiose phosphorylase
MQATKNPILEFLSKLKRHFEENGLSQKLVNEEPPLRAELFNIEQMRQYSKELAIFHKLSKEKTPDWLLKRLAENERLLNKVRYLLTDAVKENNVISPAGEWLLDNFYLIEGQIRTGKRHLPKGYSEGLPQLQNGRSEGLPRVYDIALEIIAHSDGRIDMEILDGFINEYQQIAELRLGELWAIPIMLRLALIENLRRVAVRIALDRINQNLADYWTSQMIETAEKDPKNLILVIADMARSNPPMESSFVAELTRQLLWKGPDLALPLTWMEQRLSEMGTTGNDLVNMDNQNQAADQVSISNSIGSLRFLSSVDWRGFVESMSKVEHTLCQDVNDVYLKMDFFTRDHYRHVVENIAKYSDHSENEIAHMAIDLAKKNAEQYGFESHNAHVGYFLVGNGVDELEKLADQTSPWYETIRKRIKRAPVLLYVGSIISITLIIGGWLFSNGYSRQLHYWQLILFGILLVFCCSQFAVATINWLVTVIIEPALLPRMDFSSGVPEKYSAMVVIPTMLTNALAIDELVEKLEVHFLANRGSNLFFGLITDFPDAEIEKLAEDDNLLQLAEKKIEELNNKYKQEKDIFFLFHRPRKWNPVDKVWMGYERKRGKLADLNAFLRKKDEGQFSSIIGDTTSLPTIKYIITLDTDTQLPRDAAWKMVASMAHPLNFPLRDEHKMRITKGYGILQPRISISLPKSDTSLYGRLFAGESGIDPYTRLISDVYQDLFGEGSFIGKGIYDIDAFEWALRDRFPENRILSHDLLEGCYARSGLLSDVELYEEYPSKYSADVNRRHRWIRGDWQIASWMLPFAPDLNGHYCRNALSALSRWKILDNLRRSISPIALTGLFLFTWIIFNSPLFWTSVLIALLVLPSILNSIWTILKKSDDLYLRHHISFSFGTLSNSLIQNAFNLICLPYEAYFSLEAIIRTIWRMLFTRKKLLEWNPSTNLERTSDRTLKKAYLSMWVSPFIAFLTILSLAFYNSINLLVAWPILFFWIGSPALAWWMSHPLLQSEAQLTSEQIAFLRRISRKTWAFFENFVGPNDHWLPPDNYQENPGDIIAHRTSPTNIGLALLANLSAYDFGYLSASQLIERTTNTINTLNTMEKYNGHFYNWYETLNLKPLMPLYVSTVDSGNLIAHLLTLRQGLITLEDQKILHPRLFEGISDTFTVLEEYKPNISLSEFRSALEQARVSPPGTLNACGQYLEELIHYAEKICNGLNMDLNKDAYHWGQLLLNLCRDVYSELHSFAPWIFIRNVPEKYLNSFQIPGIPSVNELRKIIEAELGKISTDRKENTADENKWLDEFNEMLEKASANLNDHSVTINRLIQQCNDLSNVEYEFLYDKSKRLFTIGYFVEDNRRDGGYYDLLASEARLCNFVAISQGKIPEESWFAMGRLLTGSSKDPVLLSWSGSMFEYLMPNLIMPEYENTLLYQTSKAVIKRQIEYCRQRGVLWGISESGYNLVDANLNYQYRAFGVPDLGLKRGLAEDLVIAPYASALALMITPEEACKNLERMSHEGFEGKFGFFEAIDYTQSRMQRGQSHVVIQSFMTHHQGMSLLAYSYLLLNQPMQKRFEVEPQFQASLLLLQERIPKTSSFYSYATDIAEFTPTAANTEIRIIKTPHTVSPEIQLLSNGRYHIMISNAGGGYSRWKELSVSRWREDATCDNWGMFCYVRDFDTKEFWSVTHQPTLREAKNYEATFTQGRAEFRRSDNNIDTYTEIVVSPEDDIEIRRIHITNKSRKRRTIDVTSYAEVVLNAQAPDVIHRTFSNLFIQTELVASKHAILCNRRKRSAEDQSPWLFHILTVQAKNVSVPSFETDRGKFIGRTNTVANPAAMHTVGELSGTYGPVLDPIVAIRNQITLEPAETVVVDMILGVSDTRDACLGLVEKYQDKHNKDRIFELAWTHSQVALRQINATEADAQLFGRLAGSVIYNNPASRADQDIIIRNKFDQSHLWSYSISGDIPIVLLQIRDSANIDLVKKMVQAHAYWRLKGVFADLVIWNEDSGGYRQLLQNQILGLIAVGTIADVTDKPGGIFVRAADQVSNEDRVLLQSVARIIINDGLGSLEDQISRKNPQKNHIPYITPVQSQFYRIPSQALESHDLVLFNGFGGFTADGQEYIIITKPDEKTPAPWVNVLANPDFGTVISESGQAYTWSENAHMLRLTPWNNDSISDSSGEAFYIRDEDSGYFWSPTPLPAKGKSSYKSRHGFGYSVFEHSEDGIDSELWVYVDAEAKIKFSILKIHNRSGRLRHLSATGYIEWVLGDLKNKSAMHVITEADKGAIFVKNPFNIEFSDRVAFFDVDSINRSFTCDRAEFLGRNGTMASPDAMRRVKLSGKVGAALDPCAAIQVPFQLQDNQTREIIFRMGAGKNMEDAQNMVQNYKGSIAAYNALNKVRSYWQQALTTIKIDTPDTSLNILTNGWLMYQTLCSRLWARTGYYQSGGAYGFRDQLQDVLSTLHTQPGLTRNHILLCASRQFLEGDVQHWWHPPAGRGVRTRCSDDYLWLPYVVSRYIIATEDTSILDEQISFLDGRNLNVDEESYYDLPVKSAQSGTLYEHCIKAIVYGLKFGEHGLPLMGSGDWNDGMDRVGRHGKGESVWLGFFLYDILNRYVRIARIKNDNEFAEKCKKEADHLKKNIEQNAWDGKWYRRAYFDDGTPLGSDASEECKIDSISQSWSIITGLADTARAQMALENADNILVNKKFGLIQLLDPPFNKSDMNPGYIKGYLPGIRENGGQYTHAAVWMIMAHAALGNTEKAWELITMINPLNHSNSAEKISVYKVEPYVMAADVYGVAPHSGRGGWTWYTGSAGWMYQLIVEWLLGIRLEEGRLRFFPCIPSQWQSSKIKYTYNNTSYLIQMVYKEHAKDKIEITLDDSKQEDNSIPLINDGKEHFVAIVLLKN